MRRLLLLAVLPVVLALGCMTTDPGMTAKDEASPAMMEDEGMSKDDGMSDDTMMEDESMDEDASGGEAM